MPDCWQYSEGQVCLIVGDIVIVGNIVRGKRA